MLRVLLVMMWVLVGWRQDTPREVISLENARQVEQLEQIGYGTVQGVNWLAESHQLAVTTSAGILKYDNDGVGVTEPATTQWMHENVVAVNFYNGRTLLAIQRGDRTLIVQNLESGEVVEMNDYVAEGHVIIARFNEDGTRLATVRLLSDVTQFVTSDIRVWETSSGGQTTLIETWNVFYNLDFQFLYDDSTLLFTHAGGFQMWEVSNNYLLRNLTLEADYEHYALSADSRYMIIAQPSRGNTTLRVYDFMSDEGDFSMTVNATIFAMAVSSNGEWIAADEGDGVLTIRSMQTGEVVSTLQRSGIARGRSSFYFSDDDSTLAYATSNYVINIFDTATWTEVSVLGGFMPWINAAAFSPDGETLAIGDSAGFIHIRNVASQTTETSFEVGRLSMSDLEFSVDGTLLLGTARFGGIGVWDVENWIEQRASELDQTENFLETSDFELSSDGSLLAEVNPQGIVLRLPGSGRRLHTLRLEVNEVISGIAFSPDATLLTSISNIYASDSPVTPMLRVWDVATGTLLNSVTASAPLLSLAYSPDVRLIATGDEMGVVTLWDIDTLTEHSRLVGHSGNKVFELVFNHDGTMLISSHLDFTIRLWDLSERDFVNVLEGHSSGIKDLALSADGTLLASAGFDGTVRLWGVR